jgi:hypothetical protein
LQKEGKKMKSLRRYLLAVLVGVATLCGSGVASSSSSLGDQVLVTPVESSSDFENIVLKSEKAWLVFLYDSSQTSKEDGDSSLKVLAKIAQVFREIVHTAAVDVRSEAGRKCAEESLSTPGFYFYGDNKTKAKKYEGRIDTQSLTEQLIQFLLEVLRSRAGEDGAGFNHSGRTQDKDKSRRQSQSGTSGIVELTDTNFDELVLSSPMVAAVACKSPTQNFLGWWINYLCALDLTSLLVYFPPYLTSCLCIQSLLHGAVTVQN